MAIPVKVVTYEMALKLKASQFPQPVGEPDHSWYATAPGHEGELYHNVTDLDKFIDYQLIFAPTVNDILFDAKRRWGVWLEPGQDN